MYIVLKNHNQQSGKKTRERVLKKVNALVNQSKEFDDPFLWNKCTCKNGPSEEFTNLLWAAILCRIFCLEASIKP